MAKMLIFVHDGCPGCAYVKKKVKDKSILADLKNRKYLKMADEAGIEYVPSAVKVEGDKVVEVCKLIEENGKIMAKCKDGKFEI